ncbi:hypothetical protein ULMS_10340 [Patiriisocius marinistellae]|uniref:Uncharacterized protein n=1 Tax=Patiriisocius marinistellae TaxID=2494560 RepID=A0A5J4FZB6_9FLAO|nr:hypothetical protein [Patiriisocius marinistellae]GEQ85526.1 hypothetical protein ULMS_10340 [Patiriisocius marinistellae]
MKNYFLAQFLLIILTASVGTSAQVVIPDSTENHTIDNGAIFQLKSENKGLMIPKISLQSRNDITTIPATLVEGLWIYNTSNLGSGLNKVSPGFYFWDGNRWEKMFNEGFTVQYEQTETVRAANTTTTYTIPGLDQNFVAPYTGTYEIHVTGYIAALNHLNTAREATVHGSYMLEIDNTKVAESTVSSNTKKAPGTSAFQALGRQTTIVHIVDLSEGDSYNFKVRARLWAHENVDPNSLNLSSVCGGAATGYAFFGLCSNPYQGNNSFTDNAQDAYLTITLLRQL